MNYFINAAALAPFFTVPCSVVDKHLKLASPLSLKILFYILRNSGSEISPENLAAFFGVHTDDITDALDYWVTAGVLCSSNPLPTANTEPVPTKTVRSKAVKPTRDEVIRRASEDEKICFLLREAQLKFGRPLKSSEESTLVWLYDDAGIDISLILMAAQYTASEKGSNIRAIERTTLEWADNGVNSIEDAEIYISNSAKKQTAWRMVEAAFGIEHRMPSTKEAELASLWVNEWNLSRELLRAAYDACIDATAKLSFPYIKKILEKWHAEGYTTPQDVKNGENSAAPTQKKQTYDMDAFLKKLNSEDE